MSKYHYKHIEQLQQSRWEEANLYHISNDSEKEKYYILDMFPYPSGTGLHVGHPLGYIASDIVARYKRMKGFNVLHPIGFDSFGLPAEQYAIQTGTHPEITTKKNINTYKEQLNSIGFSFDWDRAFRTSDPDYYRWTQWIFLKIFNSYFDEKENKAKPISTLKIPKHLDGIEKEKYINSHRLVYQDEVWVNWCPKLGTVLANEEVIGGVSERGGHPVVKKPMRQWMMRITKYAQRLLDELAPLDWPDSIKLSQKNWIGKSVGANIHFEIEHQKVQNNKITVFTTRPDTLFGVTYLVLAPEHSLIKSIVTQAQAKEVSVYCDNAMKKTDLERAELEKNKTGVFTGAYAITPLSKKKIPIWISDYVLISYGTGGVMAVPSGDQRDFDFAKKYDLPIIEVISPTGKLSKTLEEAYSGQGIMLNSGEYNGQKSQTAFNDIINTLEKTNEGNSKIQYKIRDWVFTRQRYWGEPIPIYHSQKGELFPALEEELPIILPPTKTFQPTSNGESPLANIQGWVEVNHPQYGKVKRETNTMPQWAGSCWYYLRFIDSKNTNSFASQEALDKWKNVDLYIGGAEHAVLHLLYARFWHKVLYDLGEVNTIEPFQKLINQGMIQGTSSLVYRVKGTNQFVSFGLKEKYSYETLHVDVNIVNNDILDTDKFKQWYADLNTATFILEDGQYICGSLVEKMSKSLHNVVNPNEIIKKYGADTFRLYEMFLGPLEQSKPWNTAGIDGVYKFLKKFHGLFYDDENQLKVTKEKGSKEALKIVHKTIKKVTRDIERFSLNTCVSHFMICTNELIKLNVTEEEVLSPLVVLLAPFAPHITDFIWEDLGKKDFILYADYPTYDESLIVEEAYEYPISINGKMRVKIKLPLSLSNEEIKKEVLENDVVKKWINNQPVKKVIIIPHKIVNLVF